MNSNPSPDIKHCICEVPFSDCPNAMETPHGDKWYCNKPIKPKDICHSSQKKKLP